MAAKNNPLAALGQVLSQLVNGIVEGAGHQVGQQAARGVNQQQAGVTGAPQAPSVSPSGLKHEMEALVKESLTKGRDDLNRWATEAGDDLKKRTKALEGLRKNRW